MQVHVQMEGAERVMPLTEFEELVRAGRIVGHTLVRWEPATGLDFRPAEGLQIYQGVVDAPDMRLRRAWQARNVPWMTALIVGVCIRLQLWLFGTGPGNELWDAGTRWLPAVVERREVWRLYSFGLLHGGLSHITMNMLFVAYAGVALENMFGSANLFLLFVVGVFGGGLFSSVLDYDGKAIGASSGDFALMGACVIFGWRYLEIIPARARPAFGGAILVFTLQALLNTFGQEGVDYLAHLGGLLMGGLVTSFLQPIALEGARVRNRWVQGVCGALIAGTTLGLAVFGPALMPFQAQQEDGFAADRPLWWTPGWSASGATAWTSTRGDAALVIATDQLDEATDLETQVEVLRGRLVAVDPQATLTTEPRTIGEVSGRYLNLAMTVDGKLHAGEGWLAVRGHFVHTFLVEGSNPELERIVFERGIGSVVISDPEEVQAAAKKGVVEQARAERLLGKQDRALELLRGALEKAPTDSAIALAVLETLRDPPRADLAGQIEQLLLAFPEDRRVYVEGVRTLMVLGQRERALALWEEGAQKWPKDRRLERLRREWESP